MKWIISSLFAAGLLLAVALTAPAASPPTVTEYSAGIPSGAQPAAIVAGPGGDMWFAEPGANAIGRISSSGVVTQYPIPASTPGGRGISALTVGPSGADVWFTEWGVDRLGQLSPDGGLREYAIAPYDAGSGIEALTVGPDGTLWAALSDGIARMGTSGDAAQIHHFTTNNTSGDGIVTGPDGNLWFADPDNDTVGKITPSGTVTRYTAGISSGSRPSTIAVGPDGNLWFTENYGGIGKITTTGTVTEYTAGIPVLSVPTAIVAGADGNLWFTLAGGALGRITTAGVVTTFTSGISSGSKPNGIARAADGSLWFTEQGTDAVGRFVAPAPATTTTSATTTKTDPTTTATPTTTARTTTASTTTARTTTTPTPTPPPPPPPSAPAANLSVFSAPRECSSIARPSTFLVCQINLANTAKYTVRASQSILLRLGDVESSAADCSAFTRATRFVFTIDGRPVPVKVIGCRYVAHPIAHIAGGIVGKWFMDGRYSSKSRELLPGRHTVKATLTAVAAYSYSLGCKAASGRCSVRAGTVYAFTRTVTVTAG
jgi:virginiamycin B lyase